ncbi:MAG: BamA/TamA family outer membrane protein [Williamsia sp.]|nr:BamA/TamA family outer membrane protein [Williamsia sp.]
MTKARRSSIFYYAVLILFVGGMNACSPTKYLPPGESLYTGAEIDLNGPKKPKLKRSSKKEMKTELYTLLRPKPNASILGFRYKLFAYNIAGHPKKKHSPAAWLKNKFGEPPVLLSSVNLDKNVQIVDNHLENQGYFQVDVKGDTVVKKRMATAVYKVNTNQQYTIKEVIFENDSSEVSRAIRGLASASLLKPGEPFNLDAVVAERLRIDDGLKEEGFYYFNPEYLIVKADSTIGDDKVNMYVQFKRGTPEEGKRIYTINDVFIYPSYSVNNLVSGDTSKRNAILYKDFYVVDRRNLYKPRLFSQAMRFSPEDYYSRTDHNQSLNRLINLNVFKFVKNRFEDVPGYPARLNVYYYLTPLPKQSLNAELNGNIKSNNFTGTQLTVGWRNRNFFRGGELLTINAIGGVEAQISGSSRGSNTYRAGLEGTLTFPRYLIPFVYLNTRSGFIPKTNIQLAYELINRQQYFTLNSFRASYGYSWKESPKKEHTLNPISINYVLPLNITKAYRDSIVNYPILQRTVDKQLILGTNYNYNYNSQVTNQPVNSFYFNGNLDLSGNIAGLITQPDLKNGDTVRLFNVPFAQYVRTEADVRYYRKMGPRTTWANRIIAGIGVPYGNSYELPYVKQFFVGGTNSLRAFRSRSVGPGTYLNPALINNTSKNYIYPEQTGDLKLEFNTELRQKLFSIVQGAIFVDAGNIWLYNDNPEQPGGKFTKDFLKELAVGTGVGLRFDATILVLRLDVAFPVRKPYLPDGQRWVFDQIGIFDKSPAWRKDNLVYNLGIGYPF